MSALQTLQNRVLVGPAVVMLAIVAATTYFEFIYAAPPTVYSVGVWLIAVPILLAATIIDVRSHPYYYTLVYVGFIAIGALQYLADEWLLLSGLFVLAGLAGLVHEARTTTAAPTA